PDRARERELAAEAGRQESGEAAHTIAALLDLAAVGVEIAVARVGAVRALAHHEQQLVEPDAATPVGPTPDQVAVGGRPTRRPFDDHEVVAEAIHLGEGELHGG